MKEKHFFASANTGFGFKVNFENLKSDQGFTYIIKGGSGNGKSTLMKRIGDYFLKKGKDVEFVHCSTDTESLDGVRICEDGILILDGTAPHVVETKALGALDKIVDVGKFVGDMGENKNEILHILKEKGKCFDVLYKVLGCAEKLLEVEESFCVVNPKSAELEAKTIFNGLGIQKLDRKAKNQDMFLSAIGGGGKVCLMEQNDFRKVQVFEGNLFQFSEVLKSLREKVLEFGFDTLSFQNVLNPKFFDGLCIPSISFCLIFKEEKFEDENMSFCQEGIQKLLTFAGKTLEKAKENHKKLENIYVSKTNFKEIDKLTKKLVQEIETRIKQN